MAIVEIKRKEEITTKTAMALASGFQVVWWFGSERCFYDRKTNQFKAFVKDLRLGVVRHAHAEAASSHLSCWMSINSDLLAFPAKS